MMKTTLHYTLALFFMFLSYASMGQTLFAPPEEIVDLKEHAVHEPNDAVPADVDGDGDLDVICVNRNTGNSLL